MARRKTPEDPGEPKTIAPTVAERTRPGKASTAKAAAGGRASGALSRPRATLPIVTTQVRHSMIAVAAYYRAERRGNGPGDPVQDWFEAEAEIEQQLEGTVTG